ncbi:MAG: hypothetical protein NVSMB23_12720 [Myxococcales bacterium]
MKRFPSWLFPLVLMLAWVATSGYVLSRFASLQFTLADRAGHPAFADPGAIAQDHADGGGGRLSLGEPTAGAGP